MKVNTLLKLRFIPCILFVRWLVAETADIPDKDRHKYYDAGATPFFFGLITETQTCEEINAKCIRNIIRKGAELKPGHWPNFVVPYLLFNTGRKRFDIGKQYAQVLKITLINLLDSFDI